MESAPRPDHRHDGAPAGDERIDEMVEESFPASDPPTGWAGEDPRDRPEPQDSDSSSSPSDRMSSRLAE
jgi:hypothetical protein